MTEEKKYVTFRDLRAVSPALKQVNPSTSTSITSAPSTSSITSAPSTSSTPSIGDISYPITTVDTEPTEPRTTALDTVDSSTSSTSTPSSTSTTRASNSGTPARTKAPRDDSAGVQKRDPVAPERDFQRVPNSITRKAMPGGVFRGKSKQVWDYLWSVTRGAVVPVVSTRKSRRQIKAGAGLGSMVTVDAALDHLERVGLIAVRPAVGSFTGNEYEVFTPDEASTSTPSTPSITRITQKVDELDVPESGSTSTTQPVENTGSWRPPNTSFKTKDLNTDDEAFAEFTSLVRKTVKELTGREPSKAEAARWGEVAEVLMTELRIAAGRTTVSSAPAFLAEHLRRRLWKKEKRQIEAEAAEQKESTPASKLDASRCPECFGTGMYYPEGFEKGVARCPHSKLTAEGSV